MGEDKKVHSYHTFILPFTWKITGVDVEKEYIVLKKVFDSNCFWKSINLTDEARILSKSDVDSFEKVKQFYNEYQYFFPYVRKSIYGYEDDICANYLFEPSTKDAEYIITKGDNRYKLDINAIKVRLVNTGIGIFIIECENHGKDANGKSQTDESAMKNINDYGRRITLPYLNKEHSVCADSLEIRIKDVGEWKEDFKGFINEACENGINYAENISINHMAGLIKSILSYGSQYRFVSRLPKNNHEIQVFTVLDDRMYIAYAACEKEFIKKINSENENPNDKNRDYAYISDDNLSKGMYEFAYVDPYGNCSCPDKKLCLKLLDKAVYSRWIPLGTVYTISEMGFGMITSAEVGGDLDHLYETFITCYMQMVYITIIQKASIVKFSRETTDIARHFAANGRKLTRDDIRKIMNLQERHAAFDSQLYFSEVSSEQQAIELYDMLKGAFLLETENRKLEETLTGLYEITDTDLSIRVNTTVSIMTYISIILSVGSLFYSIFFATDIVVRTEEYNALTVFPGPYLISFFAIILTSSVLAFAVPIRHNRRK